MTWREVIVYTDRSTASFNPELTVASNIREWRWFPERIERPESRTLVPWVRLEATCQLRAAESMSWPRWAWLRRRRLDKKLRLATDHSLAEWVAHVEHLEGDDR